MRHTDFAALWNDQSEDGFRNDPPNEAVTTPDQIDDEPFVMELLTANYNGNEMSFRFKMISGNLPETSVNVAVFIDTNVWSDIYLAKAATNNQTQNMEDSASSFWLSPCFLRRLSVLTPTKPKPENQ